MEAAYETITANDKEPGKTPLITDYGTLDDYLELYKKHYEERRKEFFDSKAEDKDLPQKAKRWASMSRTYLGLARTLTKIYGEKEKYCQTAQDIADLVTKDSAVRLSNLDLHYDLMKKEYPKGDPDLLRASREVEEGMRFFNRAIATQSVIISRADAVTGGAAAAELEMETEAGRRACELERRVPEGHMFLPARPFPAVEIPEGIKVPEYPEAYERMKNVPVDDLVYDDEHDEFIIRPGYVSEDGLIDDQSVVWNWEEGTVAIKFRGGEPEIWPFWKAKDAGDVPKGWPARYLRRLYLDFVESMKQGILKRK